MKGNDELAGLFRNRLGNAEMTVRDGFWEELQRDLPKAGANVASNVGAVSGTTSGKQNRMALTPRFYRITAAASVALVLGAASAAFWYFSPEEEIKEAFTQVAALTPDGSLKGDVVKETFPSIHEVNPTAQRSGVKQPTGGSSATLASQEDAENMSVTVSITITQRVFGNHHQAGNDFFGNLTSAQTDKTTGHSNATPDAAPNANSEEMDAALAEASPACKLRNWALKVAIGTSLPQGNYKMPLTAGVAAERRLNKHLALETGLQYSRLHADRTLHTLAIPVKLNVMLVSTPKVDFYAMAGGAVEKCIAGAADNGFSAEPVQLSVAAGLGVRYKLNERFALFAEPSVSHHFETKSQTKNLRAERPTNMNLLCGVRMTY